MATADSELPPIIDYITGTALPNVGAEENRQRVERFLVGPGGFAKSDVRVNVPLSVTVRDEPCHGRVDLTVSTKGSTVMVVKCVAGSPGSWLREVVAAARLLEERPVPWAVVSDGEMAVVMDLTQSRTEEGSLGEIVSLDKAELMADQPLLPQLTEKQRHKESILFRSYHMDQVNVVR